MVYRLTDEDVETIRERARAAGNGAVPARLAIAHYACDVDSLAAEILRLRADVARERVRAEAAEALIADEPSLVQGAGPLLD